MAQKKTVTEQCTIGVISDTHGLLRPQAVAALEGSDIIIHAGDIGSPEVLNRLKTIAPLFAVRGNTDHGPWLKGIPAAESVQWCGFFFHILHDLARLDLDPQAAGMHILISGHTHIPAIARKNGILYLNPGSAGPRRFSLPITLGRLTIKGKEFSPEIISLKQ